jgi:hypothetical protein
MSTRKLIKKIGYGHAISYNEYNKKFNVYRIGEWTPGTEITPESRMTQSKSAKKAIKKYMKKYRKV